MKLTQKQCEVLKAIRKKSRVLLFGGSRSGKSALIIYILIHRALLVKSRHLIVRKHSAHLFGSIISDTLPKVAKMLNITYDINKQSQSIVFHNGSEIWWGGLDDKERVEKVLGTEYSTIFANEVSTISWHAIETVVTRLAENVGLRPMFLFDENPPSKKHWSYKYFIEKKNPETNELLTNPDSLIAVQMNPSDNPNLAPEYISETLGQLSRQKQIRFLHGEFTELEGNLWTDEIINRNRVSAYPTLKRIVISVDPAVSKTESSDETGIIVVGENFNNEYYVLQDCTGKYTPNEWGNLVCRKWDEWKADLVVCEVNNGGDLVESNIRNINRNVRVKKLHVTRGKMLRAEPIVGIYEQNRAHHVGNFRDLEDEMTTYDGTGDSPNRLDALVFGISELSNEKVGIFVSKII